MHSEPSALFAAAGPLLPTYQAVDWDSTPLGAVQSWSPALLTAIDTMLHTRFPVTLFWGPEFVMVYNEAYVDLIGEKHPAALGAPAREVFAEAWHIIGPMMESVLAGGDATWVKDEPVPLMRHGFLEESYFTFSYSPLHGAGGAVEGVLDIATETTAQVVAARRQELLGQLADALADVDDVFELVERAERVLASNAPDLPVVNLLLPNLPPVTTQDGVWLPPAPPEGTGARLMVSDAPDPAAGPGAGVGGATVWLPLPEPRAGRPDRGRAPAANGSPDLPHPTTTPMMVVRCSELLPFDRPYRVFLRLVADAVAQAVGRIATRAAERALHDQERRFSTALQRSLLTDPVQPPGLEVAVRYEPATEVAQVGGDWHDAFVLPDGALAVAIGDVAGHDRDAAASMAQARNLLRGIAFTLEEPPAAVLSALDRAMAGLGVDAIATGTFARIEQIEPIGAERRADQATHGRHLLQWANAGHPPPAVLAPDGTVTLLDQAAGYGSDPLLGVDPAAQRTDHSHTLEPGATLVLYTDGLVERRGQTIDDGLDWLLTTLRGRAGERTEKLADLLIANMLPGADDDVAILVLRTAS